MAAPTQSYANHTRNFPLFHFVAFPILAGNFFYTLYLLYEAPGKGTAWQVVLAFGFIALALASRVMVLSVQDRLIRLEMQLRLMRVLPAAMHPQITALKRGHFVALRFASDQELPELVREITEGRLTTPKEIKMRVKDWQADWLRA